MIDLFYEGGPLFMGFLTILLVVMIAVTVVNGLAVLKGKIDNQEKIIRKIGYIKSVGLLAMIIGLLGQLLGLFSAFRAIELAQVDVSPLLVASGFKVSMITTIYGIIIYVLSLGLWFALSMTIEKK